MAVSIMHWAKEGPLQQVFQLMNSHDSPKGRIVARKKLQTLHKDHHSASITSKVQMPTSQHSSAILIIALSRAPTLLSDLADISLTRITGHPWL